MINPRMRMATLAVCILVGLCGVTQAPAQPPSVPRISERALAREAYVQLAKEWKKYIEDRGESAVALVNLGTAYELSEQREAALIAGRRAVEIEPDNPEALAFLGGMLATYEYEEKAEEAKKLLARCVEVAPDHKRGLLVLAAINMKSGELEESERVLKSVFDQRIYAGPVEDFAYNLLVGLPEDAVLVTNGDNDTFPCLALQAGMDFRPDVAVVNRSLLNLPSYANAMFKRRPPIKPDYDIDRHVTTVTADGKASLLSTRLIERMIDENKAPVYLACTIPLRDLGFEPEVTLEGLSYRTWKKGMTAEESARMVLEKYRLDSATGWGFAWDIVPTVSKMMWNYAGCMINLAQEKSVSRDTRRRLLEKASEIAEFHDMDSSTRRFIDSLQNKK